MAQRKPIDLSKISPLTDFLRNHKAHIESLKESGEPQILTVNGRAELVLLSAKAFQEMLTRLDRTEFDAGVRAGYIDMLEGRTMTLDEAGKKIRSELGLQGDLGREGDERPTGSD